MLDTYKRIFVYQLFTHAVVAIFVELFVLDKIADVIRGCEVNVVIPFKVVVDVPDPSATDPPDKFEPIVSAEVAVVGCIVFTYIVEVLIVDAFVVMIIVLSALVTYPVTQRVVGTLEELSVVASDAFMIGLNKKVAFDTFRTDVFVVVASTVVIVPEVACKLRIVAVEALKIDVFVVVA